MNKTTGESSNPWLRDLPSTESTNVPGSMEVEAAEIGTVVIFVVSAILLITLLFLIAIFIDCRQQKIQKIKPKFKRRIMRLKLPVGRIPRPIKEEEDTITDKMQEEPTSIHVVVNVT